MLYNQTPSHLFWHIPKNLNYYVNTNHAFTLMYFYINKNVESIQNSKCTIW